MTETLRETFWSRKCADMTPQDRRNGLRYLLVTFTWALVLLGASYLIKAGHVDAGPAGWAVALLPSAAAVFVVLAFVRYLREADELQRAIQLHALALGLSAGFVAWPAYQLFERLGAPVGDWPDLALVVIVFYVVGTFHGQWKYR